MQINHKHLEQLKLMQIVGVWLTYGTKCFALKYPKLNVNIDDMFLVLILQVIHLHMHCNQM